MAAPGSFLREVGIELPCARMGPKTRTHCPDPPTIHPACLLIRMRRISVFSCEVPYVIDSGCITVRIRRQFGQQGARRKRIKTYQLLREPLSLSTPSPVWHLSLTLTR